MKREIWSIGDWTFSIKFHSVHVGFDGVGRIGRMGGEWWRPEKKKRQLNAGGGSGTCYYCCYWPAITKYLSSAQNWKLCWRSKEKTVFSKIFAPDQLKNTRDQTVTKPIVMVEIAMDSKTSDENS